MMFVEIHDVGKIRISLHRNRFRYACKFHCIKYDSLIISEKGIFKKLTLSLENVKNVFSRFFNGLIGTTTWEKSFLVGNLYHSIELAYTFQKSISYTP